MPTRPLPIQVIGDNSIEIAHARIDREVASLSEIHGSRLKCRAGCSSCCTDGLSVHPTEAARIGREYPEVLHQQPGPAGACAFLDANGHCRVYSARPYVCRTQGLPLRWFAGEPVVEFRDICPLNDEGPLITSLPAEHCWLIGPHEASLAGLPPQGERLPLRALFK